MQLTSLRKLAMGLALAATFSAPVWAQSTTQGAISGTVFDPTEAAVANADVLIHNNGTGADVRIKTGASGLFRAPQLAPGTYTVTVSAPGFGELKSNNVVVQVQTVTELNPHLTTGSESTAIEVTADVPVIKFDSPEFGGFLSNKEIENIPINNRRWSSLALTTPGVTNNASGYGLLSFRAISTLLNNVQIDGADDNQGFYAEERGRTRAGYSTSQVAVREFQVNTGVYSAEFGRAVGGVVNTVTKSGTNALHGEVYFYRRDDAFSAINSRTQITVYDAPSNTYNQQYYRPKDKRNQYGFGIGGALIKDKLFWFYAFDEYRRNFPGTGIANNPKSFFAAPTTAAINLLSTRTGLSTAAATTAYNNQLQALLGDLGGVPRYGNQDINTPKLDWQINSKHHVSALYHRLRWDSPGGVQTQATNTYAVDTFGTDFVKLDYGLAKLNSLITDHIANELRYQYGRELNDEGQQPFSAYTKQYLMAANGNVPQVSLYSSYGFQLGSPYYSYRPQYPDERKWQVGDTMSWLVGKHNIRFGTDIVHNHDFQNNLYQGNGSYSYSTLVQSSPILNYLTDILKPAGGCDASLSGSGTLPCYNHIFQGFGQAAFTIDTTDLGFFVQDDWKLTPHFTLNLGARYDYQKISAPYSNLTTIAQTANQPSDKNNIAPRIGFSWDPFGGGKSVVRGGFGMYYGRTPNSILLSVYSQTGSPNAQQSYDITPSATSPRFPNISAATPTSTAKPAVFYFDKNFQNPVTYQFDLAVQKDLGKSNVLSVAYLGAMGRELLNYINTNLNPAQRYTYSYTIAPGSNGACGVVACGTYTASAYANSSLPYSQYATVTDVISNINSSYNALSVDLTNRSWRWITFDANYTWAHALDYSQNESANFSSSTTNNWFDPLANASASYGNSSLNVPHRAVGWAILNLPGTHSTNAILRQAANGWSVKPLVQAQSGMPYSATVSGSTPSSPGCYPTAGPTCLKPVTTSGFLGTGSTYLPQIGRNTYHGTPLVLVDTRVQKDFKVREGVDFQLLAEAFNLLNHQNITGFNGGAYSFSTSSAGVTTLTQQSNFGQASTINNNFAYRERQFQFAARLMF